MFRPQIQKTRTLFVIAFINICLVVTISNSLTYKEYDNVNLRYDSTQLMSSCIESIKDITDLKIIEEDYYQTGLIGLEQSRITTVLDNENIENILNSKIITTNSNFAAFMVMLFEEIGLEKGDSMLPKIFNVLVRFREDFNDFRLHFWDGFFIFCLAGLWSAPLFCLRFHNSC